MQKMKRNKSACIASNQNYLRVRSFGVIWIWISDPRSHGSWCIKEADESTLVTDSSVPLMYHDPSDLGSLIRIQITPKERTLNSGPFEHFRLSSGSSLQAHVFARLPSLTRENWEGVFRGKK